MRPVARTLLVHRQVAVFASASLFQSWWLLRVRGSIGSGSHLPLVSQAFNHLTSQSSRRATARGLFPALGRISKINADWPSDADGGVFRRLANHGFDFTKAHTVDYNVDFPRWPPPSEAVDLLKATYGSVELFEPESGDLGHVQFQVHGLVSYETVTSIQRRVSAAMAQFGGVCESWGVMQDAP